MDRNFGNEQLWEYAHQSGEWLCQQVEVEAILQGNEFTDVGRAILRMDPRTVADDNRDEFIVFHNEVVRLIRAAVVRSKKAGKPTVLVRDGLRLPAEWQDHYQVVYTTELPWMISFALQNAFMGNPLAGESKPWSSNLVVTDGVKKAVGWGAVGAVLATLLGG